MDEIRARSTASRRQFLRLGAAAGAAAFLAACRGDPEVPPTSEDALSATPVGAPAPGAVAAAPQAGAPAPEVAPARRLVAGDRRQLERLALPGTPWETPVYINRSGAPGPSVMVLGGVHGNEPGGWAAASEIADWMPDRGVTVVIPRANIVATRLIERTLPELGDLNRFYPGVPLETVNGLPMEWMADVIVQLAREFEVGLLLDLHESWGFFNERPQDGTAFLGQTVTSGTETAESQIVDAIADLVNPLITEREQLVVRDRNRNRFTSGTVQRPTFDPSWPRGGTSSLGLGQFVPGLVPVLVEMGQQDQAESRRSELHQLIVRTALEHEGLFVT